MTPRRQPEPPPEPRRMACRCCGCADLRVISTYKAVDGSVRRRRRCRHCGTETTTVERTLGDDAGGKGRAAG